MQLPPTVLSLNDRQKRGANKMKPKSKADDKSTSKAKDSAPSEQPQVSSASDSEAVGNSDLDSGSSIEADEASERSPDPAGAVVPLPVKPDTQSSKVYPILRPPRTLETTLFDRLEKMYGPDIKRMLKVQYRYVVCYWYAVRPDKPVILVCILRYVHSLQRPCTLRNWSLTPLSRIIFCGISPVYLPTRKRTPTRF